MNPIHHAILQVIKEQLDLNEIPDHAALDYPTIRVTDPSGKTLQADIVIFKDEEILHAANYKNRQTTQFHLSDPDLLDKTIEFLQNLKHTPWHPDPSSKSSKPN